MQLKTRIKSILNGGRNAFPDAKHRIVPAFTFEGVDYYKFDAAHGDLPYKRALAAIVVYKELEMSCSVDYLKKHVAKVNEILSAPKFTLASAMTLQKLNTYLEERLTFPFEPNLGLKLGTVVYFDESENPYDYDPKYAEEKIKRWRSGAGVRDFFLKTPLMELIPFLKSYEGDIEIYTQTIDAINAIHLGGVSGA
jgi:hypothetical protein